MNYAILQTYRDDNLNRVTGDYAYTETLEEALSFLIKALQEDVESACVVDDRTNTLLIEHEKLEVKRITILAKRFQGLGGMRKLFELDDEGISFEGLPIEQAYNDLVNAVDYSCDHSSACNLAASIAPNFNY